MNSYNECKAVVELDLDPIKFKLMHKYSGEGWTLEQASTVETQYRRFLYMMKVFPDEMLAPSEDIDTFWHYHILDTMKYARDCEDIFGYFLHHFPYVGMRGDEDLAALGQAGERMAFMYEKTFGEKYQWSPVSQTMAGTSENGTSYIFASVSESVPAFCVQPRTGETAFCMQPNTATPGFCMQPKTAATAFCMQPKTAAPAFCMQPKVAVPAFCMTPEANQDETVLSNRSGGTAFPTDPAHAIAVRGISMNAFFSTRPRLPAQV